MAKEKQRSLLRDFKAKQILVEMAGQGATDKAIAAKIREELGYEYHLETVRRCRNKLNLRDASEAPHQRVDRVIGPSLSAAPPELPVNEKADWFRQQFRDSHLYPTLHQQFDTDEINTYMEEYGQICCQFEDLVLSEFFQIDDFLKHRILINRQLVRMKALQRQIEELNAWFSANPVKEDEEPEKKRERVERYRLLDGAHASLNKSNERYDKLVAERQKIYSNLAATRRDRLDELKSSGDSFFSLLAQIQHNDHVRAQQGQYAELTRLAAEDVQKAFREEIMFPDGSKDAVILDEQTAYLDELDATPPEKDDDDLIEEEIE